MKVTQFLNFEIGRACDLAKAHEGFCPSIDRDRYGKLPTDKILKVEEIIEVVKCAVNLGFRGLIGFHYYNEPTLFFDRIMRVVTALENIYGKPRVSLLTNGTYLDENLDNLKHFERISISNYQRKDWSYIKKFMKKDGDLIIGTEFLDQRKNNFDVDDNLSPCYRPFVELVIDYYGNGHICCMDWKGDIKLGNVQKDGIEHVISQYIKVRGQVLLSPMAEEAPSICKKCKFKISFIPQNIKGFEPKIKKYVDELNSK
tara:strand:+ start:2286 stop:3056 length:771 start_codon:yes stop_codon:yes gene_type:complete